MKYIMYILMLYIFLPFNLYIDFISILVFYIIFNEDERFMLFFVFFAGVLIDLYYPVTLGINALSYLILAQILLYAKKYIVNTPVVIIALFSAFYLVKTLFIYVAVAFPVNALTILLTIVFFPVISIILNKLLFKKIWTKT